MGIRLVLHHHAELVLFEEPEPLQLESYVLKGLYRALRRVVHTSLNDSPPVVVIGVSRY
jgi:hypothetical protein